MMQRPAKEINSISLKKCAHLVLSGFFPPGFAWQQEILWDIAGLIFSFLYSTFTFGTRFSRNLEKLYVPDSVPKILLEGAQMTDFIHIFHGCLLGFFILMIWCIPQTVLHYRYHYQGSKSIYLMRRLPRRGELHKRCVTVPAAVLLLTGFSAFVTMLFFFGIYHLLTPDAALTPDQWHKLWSQGGIL